MAFDVEAGCEKDAYACPVTSVIIMRSEKHRWPLIPISGLEADVVSPGNGSDNTPIYFVSPFWVFVLSGGSCPLASVNLSRARPHSTSL